MQKSVRTISVLGVVAAALLAYIVFVDRGNVTSGDVEKRKGSALPEFVRARVARIELQRKGATTVLARDPELTDEGGLWRVEAPFQAKADSQLVDGLLSEFEYLDAKRRIVGITEKDRKQFGLEAPRYRIAITIGKLRVPVVVGNETPSGDGVYLQTRDPSLAYVVGQDLLEALNHDATDYHSKELHDGLLVTTTQAVTLHDAQGERGAHRLDLTFWALDKPALGLASAPVVAEIINALDALRAKHFVTAGAKDLGHYGLDQPRFELTVLKTHLAGGDAGVPREQGGEPKREKVTLRIRVGSSCDEHAGESYVALDDARSGVYCALDTDLQKMQRPLSDLIETRLLPLDDDEIETLQLDHGDRHLLVRKEKEQWWYEATRAGVAADKRKARPDAVKEWLAALRAQKAVRVEPDAGAVGRVNAITLKIERGKGKTPYTLRVDASHPDQPRAQRGDEAQTLVLEPSALDLLEASASRLKPLALLHLDEGSLRALDVRRGSLIEHLSRTEASAAFVLDAPLRAAVDNSVSAEVTRLLSSLEAVRFVSARATSFGLDAPAAIVSFDATNTDSKAATHVVLRLGAETEDGRYAELTGEQGVFVVAPQLARRLSEPLVSRSLLASPLDRIEAVKVEKDGKAFVAQKSGDAFEATGRPDKKTSANALASVVATLRATRATNYGPANAQEGIAAPWARIVVTLVPPSGADVKGAHSSYTISIGTEASGGGRYARRDDFAVGFVLPKDAIEGLIAPLELR